MSKDHESIIHFDDWRTSRMIDALFHAEKVMPGVWRLVKSMKDHEGALTVEIFNERFEMEIKDAFVTAWEKVGENPDLVEVGYKTKP